MPGEIVGRFQVRRLVGQGGMGRVYLARDQALGRSVALKLVAARGTGPDDTEREARITAQLNHPHIVQLFDVGRHRGVAYLALEYLEGESLRERLARERPSVDEGLRILRAIADALAHAHARGVWHCDLKPSNVMLPRDGRLRVVDFGLATERSRAGAPGVAGTADWMAPEQWRGEQAGGGTDIWALAVIAYELLAGEHPFGDGLDREARRARVIDPGVPAGGLPRGALPDDVVALIVRSLDRSPLARPSAREWVAALDRALAGSREGAVGENPFRGLSAFEERHAQYYFGRADEIDAFLERLRDATTLSIVGPSGVGKSSFLFAGVVPRLRARERWTVVSFRPGGDPIAALAHRLAAAGERAESDGSQSSVDRTVVARLADDLRAQPGLLACRLATIAAATGTRVLLAVDQLEEAFTHGATAEDRERFLAMLTSAADDAADPVRVTFTLRDDFLGRVPGTRTVVVLSPLDDARLRRAITGPVERLAYRFETDAMVDAMLDAVRDSPAALPLTQFACRALWDARDEDRRVLLESAYRSQGGVAGALARHADSVLLAMSDDEQRMCRLVFMQLVVGTKARRAIDRGDLLAGIPEWAASVLGRLLDARLLVERRVPGRKESAVEIVHESLLVTWDRLARWLEESGEERRLLVELDEAVTFWEKRGRRPEETWSEDEVASTRRHAEKLALRLPERLDQFLAMGEARAAARRRRSRQRRMALSIAAAVVTVGSTVFAVQFRRQRDASARQAEALRLARGNMGAIELVLEPFDWVDGHAQPVPRAALTGLRWRLFGPSPDDMHLPGAPIPNELVRVVGGRVEAPGGTAFLRIEGRQRAGEAPCAASWVRLVSLPGYADRQRVRRLVLGVPTCQASLADTVLIPAGPFVYGGPGDPATRPEYVERERVVDLPGFRIDRFEASNARYAPFAALTRTTGYPVPQYPEEPVLPHSADPRAPVTALDAYTAEAFCRFLGKRLPTDYEWTKAARGGLTLDGRPNPVPRRLFPWGVERRVECANLDGEADGFRWMAPVDALTCGASPYGVLNLAGNASEWIARTDQSDPSERLRVARGGARTSPIALEHGTTVFRNTREPRFIEFLIGLRCAADDDALRGSSWERH